MRRSPAAIASDDAPLTDISEASRFLDCLGAGEVWTFQTFDENAARKARALTRVLHGTLAEHAGTLKRLQAQGAGAFVMVNRGDGNGRKTANVTAVRAVFVDLDGAPLQPVRDAPLPPHVIIETSPSRFHAYWRVCDCPLPRFESVQRGLIEKFRADAKVKDLPRVMRLPGFLHMKRAPFQSRILNVDSRPAYRLTELELAFPEVREKAALPQSRVARDGKEPILEGSRNSSLLSMGATWRNRGLSKDGVLERLRTVNRKRCTPPLLDSEVCAVTESVISYACEQGLMLSALELKAMLGASFAGRAVYLAAKQQHEAGNEDRISLTLKDMSAHGFPEARKLRKAIGNARSAGLLKLHRAAVYQRQGEHRLCALYELPLCSKRP